MKAYVTLVSTDAYLTGALILHNSLAATRPEHPLVVLMTSGVSEKAEQCLKRLGVDSRRLPPYPEISEEVSSRNRSSGNAHWNSTFSKLAVFSLTEFQKIVFLDSDMIVLQNLDHLFEKPHGSAVVAGKLAPGNESWTKPNTGVMVIEPAPRLAGEMYARIPGVAQTTPSIGDQDIIQAQYPHWPQQNELHLDQRYNIFSGYEQHYIKRCGYNLNLEAPDEKTIAVIHFVGPVKPWLRSPASRLAWIARHALLGRISSARMLWRYHLAINEAQLQLAESC